MKLFNLLFLVITLITLQKSTAKEVAFADSIYGKLFIDSHHACRLEGCRYNDAGVVFCEVYFDVDKFEEKCVPYGGQYERKCETKINKETIHYRIRIELSQSGKCNLSKSNKFKDTKLLYNYKGVDNYAQLFADCWNEVYEGRLPSNFYTNKDLVYHFTFKTTDNCTFKGYFSKIKAYKA